MPTPDKPATESSGNPAPKRPAPSTDSKGMQWVMTLPELKQGIAFARAGLNETLAGLLESIYAGWANDMQALAEMISVVDTRGRRLQQIEQAYNREWTELEQTRKKLDNLVAAVLEHTDGLEGINAALPANAKLVRALIAAGVPKRCLCFIKDSGQTHEPYCPLYVAETTYADTAG